MMTTKHRVAKNRMGLFSGIGRPTDTECRPRMTKALHPGYLAFFTVLLVGLLLSSNALAHKVRVFAYVEGDNLIAEGYFSKSAKARNCLIGVYDSGENKIAEARTDANGSASFKLTEMPAYSGDLTVVLEAGQGHKASFTVAAAELPSSTTSEQRKESTFSRAPEPKPSQATQLNSGKEIKPVGPNPEKQAIMMEKVLDRKLEPIIKMLGNQRRMLLAQQDRGNSLRDVIGGIGWILGIVGVAAYVLSRRQANKK
jgi:nickel transport protein